MTQHEERRNVHDDGPWERELDEGRFGLRGRRMTPTSTRLGMMLYEVPPGRANLPYHAHHGVDEVIVVLAGAPTLRSPSGERVLEVGEVVECPAGSAGAHQLRNDADEPARVLIASSKADVDVVEYPDSGKLQASGGEWGSPGFRRWILDATTQLEYFDGEQAGPE